MLLFACSVAAAYALYRNGALHFLPQLLHGRGYVSMLLGGMLFSFGFTTPFGIAIFFTMAAHVDPLLGAVVGGTGAMLSDMTIFQLVRVSFADEFHRLAGHRFIRWCTGLLHRERWPQVVRSYLLWSVAGLVIASPLPDEIGVTLLGGATHIERRPFAVLSLLFNTLGIFAMLLLAGG